MQVKTLRPLALLCAALALAGSPTIFAACKKDEPPPIPTRATFDNAAPDDSSPKKPKAKLDELQPVDPATPPESPPGQAPAGAATHKSGPHGHIDAGAGIPSAWTIPSLVLPPAFPSTFPSAFPSAFPSTFPSTFPTFPFPSAAASQAPSK